VEPLSIVSERSEKINNECEKTVDAEKLFISNFGGELYENWHYWADFSFELQIIKVLK
jgi:hypothetical protein